MKSVLNGGATTSNTDDVVSDNISGHRETSFATEEEKKIDGTEEVLLKGLKGTLRKKGFVFNNERRVELTAGGLLNYFHFDKPGAVKGNIDLRAARTIRFSYTAGVASLKDRFRIETMRDTFIFRTSQLHHGSAAQGATSNPTVRDWENAIKQFSSSVSHEGF